MARLYRTPGVNLEGSKVPAQSIAEVETAIPAFIGYTEKVLYKRNSLKHVPTRISSVSEYTERFGGPHKEEKIEISINDSFRGEILIGRTIIPKLKDEDKSPYRMFYALQMYFLNGGGPCYIVSAGRYKEYGVALEVEELRGGIASLANYDEPTIIVIPDGSSLAEGQYYRLMGEALTLCSGLPNRFAIIDVLPEGNNTGNSVTRFRDSIGDETDKLKFGAAYFPYLKTSLGYSYDDNSVQVIYTNNRNDRASLTLAQIKNPRRPGLKDNVLKCLGMLKRDGSAKPNPELYNSVKDELTTLTVTLPPSAAVAGAFVRTDKASGVWKAPANVSLNYVIGLSHQITGNENGMMNTDISGKSVNAIRFFPGRGILIWGARTLAGNDNEWRYIPVRRFFNFVSESVNKGTKWVMFEPNDANTWTNVRKMAEDFMTRQWRAGALVGTKPEVAFYVKAGPGTTMTDRDVSEGRIIIEIGMALLKPAEFAILRITHNQKKSNP
jgi:uncharacterized protein